MNYSIIFTRTLFNFIGLITSYYLAFSIAKSLGYNSFINWLTWPLALFYLILFIAIATIHEYRQTKTH